jgi:hypothetical protein
MGIDMYETEEQRRRRVSSRIRNEVRAQVIDDLVEMARVGKLPDGWATAAQLNALLDEAGYWLTSSHVMARFMTSDTCQDVLEKALESLTCTHPELWVRAGDQFKPACHDWKGYASEKANVLRQEMPLADRTALVAGADGESILFGHDDYTHDPRAREEVTQLRGILRQAGIPELGFGLSDDGMTWVMVVWSQDEQVLNRALMEAWQAAYCSAPAAA